MLESDIMNRNALKSFRVSLFTYSESRSRKFQVLIDPKFDVLRQVRTHRSHLRLETYTLVNCLSGSYSTISDLSTDLGKHSYHIRRQYMVQNFHTEYNGRLQPSYTCGLTTKITSAENSEFSSAYVTKSLVSFTHAVK